MISFGPPPPSSLALLLEPPPDAPPVADSTFFLTADGLMITNPKMPLFNLQFKRLAPDGKWSRANWFAKKWSKANGGQDASQWFRNDATVKKLIDQDGVFGVPGLKPEE